ncbi:MAG: type II toxin-antitoxin system death-on-curing family toxin [Synergistaceae bacterium]|nr:type II toxin-antitoxin system death-on-curing family toxin [Synergistaceae bacterium]
MIFLNQEQLLPLREQILLLHEEVIEQYGGSHGIRDEKLLDSALSVPFQSFGDFEFYPTVLEKAVRLCFGLVMNHPFIDGNKRVGAAALLATLKVNNISYRADRGELSEVILSLSSGKIDYEDLLRWVRERVE